MKSKIVFIPVLALTIFFLSDCSHNDQSSVLEEVPFDNGKITKVLIERIDPEVREVKLSDLIGNFRVIPLENKEECLISNTWITFCKNYILVGTQNFPEPARAYRFDHQGKFIDEIGSPGKGPGEHTGYMPEVIHCYEDNHTIMTKWNGVGENPQLFDYQGSFLGEIEQPYTFMNINKWSDSVWFSTGAFAGKPWNSIDSLALVFFNGEGKILKQIPRRSYPPENSKAYSPYPPGTRSLYRYHDQWRLYMNGNDTVFKITNMSLTPVAVLAPGKKILPFNESISPNQLSGKYSLDILTETNGNWFIKKKIIKKADLRQNKSGRWGGAFESEDQIIIIDKRNEKGANIRLVDDIFHLFPDEYFSQGFHWKDDRLFFAFPPIMLKELIEETNIKYIQNPKAKKVIDKIKQMSEDDNPVIFSFTLNERYKI